MKINQKESKRHFVNLSFFAETEIEKSILSEIRDKLRPFVHNDDVEALAIDIGFNTWRKEDFVNSMGITIQITEINEKGATQD